MLYIRIRHGRAISATLEHQSSQNVGRSEFYETRNDWHTMERAQKVAAQLTKATGTLYIATDAGRYTSPQFDVIEAPRVGQLVSKAFNGDSYPEGDIVKISASRRRIETSTGVVFYRHRQSGVWISNRTWHMVDGHHCQTNPSF